MSKEGYRKNGRHYYRIAGVTIQIESDLPITDFTFDPKFKLFEVDGPGEDTIVINHHFSLPDLDGKDLGVEVYRKMPWVIYRKEDSWRYLSILHSTEEERIYRMALFNHDYSSADIYSDSEREFRRGCLESLTLFPTDQVLIAQILADRNACYVHSSGVSIDGKGIIFVGHSEAGKSTMAKMLKDKAEILCDDRIIVRRWPDGFKIHGTWSHGEVPDVSASSAIPRAILFLEKAQENFAVPIVDRKESIRRLLPCIVRPLITADWWNKTLSIVEDIVCEIPCYLLHFDKSGKVVDLLERL